MTNPWDALADDYDAAQGETGDLMHQYLFDPAITALLGDVNGQIVLDAGCGNGYFSRRLAKTAKKVVGFDESAKLVAHAKSKENPSNVEFKQMDLMEDLDLPDEYFDAAISCMVFQFLPSIDKAASELARALMPGARFIFCTQHPFYQAFYRAQELAGKKSDFFESTVPYFREKGVLLNTLDGKGRAEVFQRTFAGYLQPFFENGFTLTGAIEPEPPQELIDKYPNYIRLKEAPRVIVLRFKKI